MAERTTVRVTRYPASPTPKTSAAKDDRSLASVIRDLAEGSADLVRAEARLLQLEIGSLVESVGRGSAEIAAGSVLLLLGGLSILVGIVLLIGGLWIVGQYWLAALIVFVISGAVALAAGSRGARLLSPARLAPSQTLATLKEDVEWSMQQMRSDATSK